MTDWLGAKLGDLVSIKHGYAFKGEYFRDAPPGDVLLTPGNFAIGGGFQFRNLKYYDGPAVNGFVLSPGDLLVTMTDLSKEGDTLGYPAIVPTDGRRYLHNQRLGKVTVVDPTVSPGFLYWLMRTKPYRDEVLSGVTGSTVKHTSPKKIEAFEFRLPSRLEQDAICDVLFVLDDKIELNRRMNATLEAMAQAIFCDWFVDFGPVRRKLAGVTDPVEVISGLVADPSRAAELAGLFPEGLGEQELPDGWRLGNLDALADTVGEGVSPSSLRGETPYIGLEHMPRRSIVLESWGYAGKVSSQKTRFSQGQVLFGKLRPYFHKVGIAPIDGVCSTDIVVLESRKPFDRALVASCVSSDAFVAFTDQASTGTKMPRTSWAQMKTYELAIADERVRRAFSTIVGPMHDKIIASISEGRTLAETRDYLLPRLMSGEVRVSDVAQEIAA